MGNLADNIKTRLTDLGMTQKELAESAGISQVMIHKLLSGKSKSTAKILDLATALRCDPYILMSGNCNELADSQGSFPNLGTFLVEKPTEKEILELLAYLRGMRVPK